MKKTMGSYYLAAVMAMTFSLQVAAADLQSPALIVIGAVASNYSAKREAGLLAARYGASAGTLVADSAPLQSLNLECAVSMA